MKIFETSDRFKVGDTVHITSLRSDDGKPIIGTILDFYGTEFLSKPIGARIKFGTSGMGQYSLDHLRLVPDKSLNIVEQKEALKVGSRVKRFGDKVYHIARILTRQAGESIYIIKDADGNSFTATRPELTLLPPQSAMEKWLS